MPEPKATQLDRVQPHSAGPAELSVPEPVVEVSCILITLSGHHARLEVWLLNALALLTPLIDQNACLHFMLSGLHARIEVWPSVSTSHPSPTHSSY